MTDFNPIHFLQHAWDETISNWGKACVVLFYLYIWSQAIWAIESTIVPKAGWECMYQGLSGYATELVLMFFRAMNVMVLGFLMYAHREGIKVWNVSMVFIFNALMTWIFVAPDFENLDGMPSCDDGMIKAINFITWAGFWWTVLILLCSALEERSKPRGTTTETTPIY